MSQILGKIEEDLLFSQKSKDEIKTSTLRFLMSKIHDAQIEKGKDKQLTDDDISAEIAKEIRRHRESVEAAEKAARTDLARKEAKELEILQSYLPSPLTREEIENLVDQAIEETGAQTPADFGKVMGVVMAKAQSRADGSIVSEIVRSKLTATK